MEPIKIMELRGTYKGGGGPDKTILLSAARHRRKDFFVLVTYLRDPLDSDFQIGNLANKYNVPDYIEVYDRSKLDFKCLFELHNLIKMHSINIIHVHDEKSTLLGFLLKVLNPRVKIMHTAHGWITNTHGARIKQKIQFLLLKFYPFHIAVSEATKKLMIASGISPKSIKVLYNAIDTTYWQKTDQTTTLRKELKIPENSFVIGIIGRLSKEKDLRTFFQIAANILRQRPNTHFLVVGDGKGRIVNDLHKLINKLKINGNVIFTGHRTDLINVYATLDLFLLTSITEGLPNTLLEAMAMGVPVVATRVGGVPELINQQSGKLCNVGDVAQMTECAIDLMTDSVKRRSMIQAARQRIEEKFSFNRRLNTIEEYYINLAKGIGRK